jgi:multidrug efflux system outer membrane protein
MLPLTEMKSLMPTIQCPKFFKFALRWTLGFGLLTLFAGCTVGPNYEREKVSVGKNFGEANSFASTNAPESDWWKTFGDPELDKLISDALRENNNLKIASARLRQSRAQRGIAAADLFPQVDADAGYAISRGSKNMNLPLGGSGGSSSGSGGSSGSSPVQSRAQNSADNSQNDSGNSSSQNSGTQNSSSGGSASSGGRGNDSVFDDQLSPFGKGGLPGHTTQIFQAGFDATWEIDIFGGKRRLVEAANADVTAAIENRRDLTITIIAEVARDYFELRGMQTRWQIAQTNLAAQNEIIRLTRARAQIGLTSQADSVRAASEAEMTAASIPPLTAATREMVHAISILLGQEPDALSDELEKFSPFPKSPPQVPVGLPSQLIERRPDIREAEARIRAANARIGNAQADLFPKFALVGNAGLDSSAPQNLFKWDSEYFLISPTVTWRIFDAGRILSNIELQKSIKRETALQYHSTILQALREVEDALVNYANERMRKNNLENAWLQNQLALQLAQSSYDHGLSNFLDVLDAERNFLSSEDELAQSDLALTTDLVALYKALGGGWK